MPLNLCLLNERCVVGCYWGAWKVRSEDTARQNRANIERMLEHVAAGMLRPRAPAVFPLEKFGDAYEMLATRRAVGKVCVNVGGDGGGAGPSKL